jgi:hypothetical protein
MSGPLTALGMPEGVIGRRVRIVLAGLLLGGVALALTLAFLALSAYLALLEWLPPWQAALGVGGGAFFVAIVALVIAFGLLGRTSRQLSVAVRSSALALIAPAAARIALNNARLTVGIAGLATALIALRRVFVHWTKTEA